MSNDVAQSQPVQFRVGDRVRIREGAPVNLGAHSDRMGIVLTTGASGLSEVWVHSQCCEFELDFTELDLVARAIYATPERIETLDFMIAAAESALRHALFDNEPMWRRRIEDTKEMLREARGEA